MPAQVLVDNHLRLLKMEPTAFPSDTSNQQLFSGDEGDGSDTAIPSLVTSNSHLNMNGRRGEKSVIGGVTAREWVTVVVLCFVNLINYMDRFTIAGILSDIQKHFNVGDDMGGLLQTAFVLSYMVFAPLFGYLGDRYSRRTIMAFGVFLWSLTTLLGSFMETYGTFLIFRTLVGIGEASYSTIAPTIISDLFVKNLRSKMLALFYFAIPVGSGLGYIIGSETARIAGSWHWGLRVTPILGAVAVLLIIFVMHEPERGKSEGMSHLSSTSWSSDIKHLLKNWTFMLSTIGFTCVAFVAGALAWWGPTFIHSGLILQPGNEDITLNDVAYKFGIIAMVSGLVGVPAGALLATTLRPRYPRIDPLICATGLLISAPLLFAASLLANKHTVLCYTCVFFGEVFLNLNWSIVADMLLYVVIPTRRSTAEAFQILISHAFGDAGSPYLIGLISEALKLVLKPSSSASEFLSPALNSTAVDPSDDPEVKFYSLQYALFTTSFVEVLGGFFFLLTAMYIIKDKLRCENAASGDTNQPTHLFAEDAHLPDDQPIT